MSDKPEWVKLLEAKPCECVVCPECRGTGNVFFAFGGKKYLGSSRWDDLDEMEPCDTCRGGIVMECDRCADLDDYDAFLESDGIRFEPIDS